MWEKDTYIPVSGINQHVVGNWIDEWEESSLIGTWGEGETDSNKKTGWGVKEEGVPWTTLKIGLQIEYMTKTGYSKIRE